jgi:hypothetical protein
MQPTITTQGGDVAARDIDKRSGIFINVRSGHVSHFLAATKQDKILYLMEIERLLLEIEFLIDILVSKE